MSSPFAARAPDQPEPAASFSVTVDVVGSRALVAVHGEVDMVTAGDLGAILHAVIDRGHHSVVLDLASLVFIDASGLGVVAGAADRLSKSGGSLTIASAAPMVRHILAITGLGELTAQPQASPAVSAMASTRAGGDTLLADHLRTVTALPATSDLLESALQVVVTLARATVGGADGVSVSLQRHGRLRTVAATDQTISDMDRVQYRTGEGPCIDASVQGRWFHAESLAAESRWPTFTPRAHALGINAILSSPLVTPHAPVGALNIYSRSPAAFGPKEQVLAGEFAAEASRLLSGAALDVTEETLATRLQEALRSRQLIAQAQGVLMAREGVTADEAYGRLRADSQRTNQPLRARAEDVVSSTHVSVSGADHL